MSEVIEALQKKIAANLRVAMPAIIKKYDFKTQRADVAIDIKELYYDGSSSDYPMISGVPVIFPSSGGASITMPVKVGDGCLLIFLDRDGRNWLLGASGLAPQSRRVHHLSDAVAIIGLTAFNKVSNAENNEDVLLKFSGSNIRLKPGGIIDIHNAKEVNVKTENVVINCKNAKVNAEESANIETKTANIKASETINMETPIFTQKGNMKIEGNVEITGTSLLKDKLTSQNGIENSGANLVSNGKVFETHTHLYQDVTVVIAPEGLPCQVTKIPTPSEQP
jgi:phage gp45-like